MTTPETITPEQIQALRREAAEAGDLTMVATCDGALVGDRKMIARCAEAIADAEGQR